MRVLLRRLRSTFTALLACDCLALFLAFLLACLLREMTGGHLPWHRYVMALPSVLLFPLLYGFLGLYPGVFLAPHDELKRLSIGTSLGFLALCLFLFLGQQGLIFSRAVALVFWLLALCLVPLFRAMARKRLAPAPWWGYPVILFCPDNHAQSLATVFFSQRERGIFVAKIVSFSSGQASTADNAALTPEKLAELRKAHPDALACILGESLELPELQELIFHLNGHFRRIAVKLDVPWMKQLSLRVADFPCGPVLTMRQNLLDPRRRRMKRLLELALCLCSLPVLLLAIPAIALYIYLDDPGDIFFSQWRIGQRERPFRAWKFRTMKANAEEILERELEKAPELAREWLETQKLTNDPRLTRAGRILRRLSLDELPQIFNVFKGDMSLVGPRPIVEEEVERYGETFDLYCRVRPGLTGLWQVSGRNDLPYEERVRLDRFYVYNWSVWLDIYIILKTFPTLWSGRGAY